jgi:hypothetical protein
MCRQGTESMLASLVKVMFPKYYWCKILARIDLIWENRDQQKGQNIYELGFNIAVYNILFSIVMSIQLSLLLILPYFFLSRLYITYTIDSVILHIILIEVSLKNSYHRIYNASVISLQVLTSVPKQAHPDCLLFIPLFGIMGRISFTRPPIELRDS